MEKQCRECGEKLKGRSDKLFCSDQCRNSYNNKLKSGGGNYIRNVNNLLRKNRKVLEELLSSKGNRSSREKMLGMGFNFGFYTNTYVNPKGATYFFCYEYGYLPLEKDVYLLVKWKEKEK